MKYVGCAHVLYVCCVLYMCVVCVVYDMHCICMGMCMGVVYSVSVWYVCICVCSVCMWYVCVCGVCM